MCGVWEGIKDIGRSIDDGVHSLGRGIDSTVRDVVPGGWGTLAAGAGLAFGLPPGTLGSLGGSLGGLGSSLFGGMGSGLAGLGSNLLGGMGGLFGGAGAGAANPYSGMGFYGFGAGGGETAGGGGMGGLGNLFGGAGGSSNLGSVGDLLRGGFGLYQANQLRQASEPSAINQQAEQQLQSLMANPSGITSMPGYEAGLEAVQRGMAARGFLGSGNMATALQKYGGDFYNQALGQFANLSQLGRGGADANRMGGIQLAGQALNSLGYGALNLFGK